MELITKSILILTILTSCLIHQSRSSNPVTIHCNYRLKFHQYLQILYTCESENVIATSTDSAITNITGIHFGQPIYSNNSSFLKITVHKDTDVKAIDIQFSVVLYFPKNLSRKFPSLVAISILSSKLREIHQRDLREFPALEYLSLRGNDIQVIEAGLFAYNKKLAVVSFNHNHIKHVDVTAFRGLSSLKTLQVALNPCLGHRKDAGGPVALTITDLYLMCKPRRDESTDWKWTDDEAIEDSCECPEITVTGGLLGIGLVGVVSYLIFEKFVGARSRTGRDDKIELVERY